LIKTLITLVCENGSWFILGNLTKNTSVCLNVCFRVLYLLICQ